MVAQLQCRVPQIQRRAGQAHSSVLNLKKGFEGIDGGPVSSHETSVHCIEALLGSYQGLLVGDILFVGGHPFQMIAQGIMEHIVQQRGTFRLGHITERKGPPKLGAPFVDEQALADGNAYARLHQPAAGSGVLRVEEFAAILLESAVQLHSEPSRNDKAGIEKIEVVLAAEVLLFVSGLHHRVECATCGLYERVSHIRAQVRLPSDRMVLCHQFQQHFPGEHLERIRLCMHERSECLKQQCKKRPHSLFGVSVSFALVTLSTVYRSGGNPFSWRQSSYQIGTSFKRANPIAPEPTRRASGHG